MEQQYTYSIKWEENIVVILIIYEDRATFLPFYDDKDTLSTKGEIQKSISQLISTHKNIPKTLWENDIHSLQNGRKRVW